MKSRTLLSDSKRILQNDLQLLWASLITKKNLFTTTNLCKYGRKSKKSEEIFHNLKVPYCKPQHSTILVAHYFRTHSNCTTVLGVDSPVWSAGYRIRKIWFPDRGQLGGLEQGSARSFPPSCMNVGHSIIGWTRF